MKTLIKIIKKYLSKRQIPRILAIIGSAIIGFAFGSYFGALIIAIAALLLEELLIKALKKKCISH